MLRISAFRRLRQEDGKFQEFCQDMRVTRDSIRSPMVLFRTLEMTALLTPAAPEKVEDQGTDLSQTLTSEGGLPSSFSELSGVAGVPST
uniref:RIKEN cDNA 1700025C18 gene n=1 Tax=Mus spicilegus TaxID=10103 RepID=A0A8C6HX18_MUSSI